MQYSTVYITECAVQYSLHYRVRSTVQSTLQSAQYSTVYITECSVQYETEQCVTNLCKVLKTWKKVLGKNAIVNKALYFSFLELFSLSNTGGANKVSGNKITEIKVLTKICPRKRKSYERLCIQAVQGLVLYS